MLEESGGSLLAAGFLFLEYQATGPGQGSGVCSTPGTSFATTTRSTPRSPRLDFGISDDVLRIDLCPPRASCVALAESVGAVTDRFGPLVLTQQLAAQPGSVLRFDPALPG